MNLSIQLGLDVLLAQLQITEDTTRVRGKKKTRGSGGTNDQFVGDDDDNTINGHRGDDLLLGNEGEDRLFGDSGDDVLFGGQGNDKLQGNRDNDKVFGDQGDDRVSGGAGDDLVSGGEGLDRVFGDAGDDILFGDAGDDMLWGGEDDDILTGGDGVDMMAGGEGSDQFAYAGDLFANGTPALAGQTGIQVLNRPDIISDFSIAEDQFSFDGDDADIDAFTFQRGQASQLSGNANLIVLTDPFAAAGAAARAIANNNNVTAEEGVFVYFNSTLGITRMVYSEDLSDGGNISVLANLTNQRGDAGLTNLANFSAENFTLV